MKVFKLGTVLLIGVTFNMICMSASEVNSQVEEQSSEVNRKLEEQASEVSSEDVESSDVLIEEKSIVVPEEPFMSDQGNIDYKYEYSQATGSSTETFIGETKELIIYRDEHEQIVNREYYVNNVLRETESFSREQLSVEQIYDESGNLYDVYNYIVDDCDSCINRILYPSPQDETTYYTGLYSNVTISDVYDIGNQGMGTLESSESFAHNLKRSSYTYYEDGIVSSKNEYNENGNLLNTVTYDTEGNVDRVFIYAQAGDLDSYTRVQYQNGHKVSAARFVDDVRVNGYKYHNNGTMSVKYWYQDGSIDKISQMDTYDDSQTVLYSYRYLTAGDNSSYTRFAYTGGVKTSAARFINNVRVNGYKYHSNGKMSVKYWYQNGLTSDISQIVKYDEYQSPTYKYVYPNYEDSSTYNMTKYKKGQKFSAFKYKNGKKVAAYTYDDAGNVVYRYYFDSNENKTKRVTYDSKGKVIKTIYY